MGAMRQSEDADANQQQTQASEVTNDGSTARYSLGELVHIQPKLGRDRRKLASTGVSPWHAVDLAGGAGGCVTQQYLTLKISTPGPLDDSAVLDLSKLDPESGHAVQIGSPDQAGPCQCYSCTPIGSKIFVVGGSGLNGYHWTLCWSTTASLTCGVLSHQCLLLVLTTPPLRLNPNCLLREGRTGTTNHWTLWWCTTASPTCGAWHQCLLLFLATSHCNLIQIVYCGRNRH